MFERTKYIQHRLTLTQRADAEDWHGHLEDEPDPKENDHSEGKTRQTRIKKRSGNDEQEGLHESSTRRQQDGARCWGVEVRKLRRQEVRPPGNDHYGEVGSSDEEDKKHPGSQEGRGV